MKLIYNDCSLVYMRLLLEVASNLDSDHVQIVNKAYV